jgi:hypothetical protein
MSYKGYFKPRTPDKYLGNPSNIIYRSLWELKFMRYLDSHPQIISWASEEFSIPYRSPLDGKIHKYYPDFFIKKITPDGKQETLVIEIKPKAQIVEPKVQSKVTKRYLKEVATYGVNAAKWKAAIEYCKDRNWEFKVMTENELGVK